MTNEMSDRTPNRHDRVARRASLFFFLAGLAVGIGSGLKLAEISIGIAVVVSALVVPRAVAISTFAVLF